MTNAFTPSAHTPGPWHIGKRSGITCNIQDANGEIIGCSAGKNFETNARLMTAAPELLDAVKMLSRIVHDELGTEEYGSELSHAEGVIAQAESH